MMKIRGYGAALGLALMLSGIGVAGAQGMPGMMGSGMKSGCPMAQGMQGAGMHGRMGMHGGGMGMHGGGMGMHGGGMGMMMQRLDLDEQQRTELQELRSEHRRARFERMADMLDLRDEMHAAMAADRPDPATVRDLHGRMADLRGEMLADGIGMRNAMQDLLTEEQREQLREYRRGNMPHGMMGRQGSGGMMSQ